MNSIYQEVNSTTAVFTGLHPHYFYSFSVAAFATDSGPFSEIVGIYTAEDGKTYTNFSILSFSQ